MSKAKRLLSVIMALIMVLTVLPISMVAFAADTATVSVESVNAVPGSTVDVNVNLTNNPGIMAAAFTITYDDGLTLVDAKSGDAFSALSMTKPESFSSPCKFAWDALDLAEEDIKDGTILTLTFDVAENIEANSNLNVKITYSSKDIIDSNIQSVPLNVNNGKVTIIDYIPGDLNSDGIVDLKDVTMIRRYITGYSVSVNELAADVNGDGDVTMMDVVLIRRYVVDAEGYGVILVPGNSKVHTHTMTATPAKEAICTEDGNIAYWYCSSCEKYFTDENGTTEVSQNDTIITAPGHTVVVDPAVEATYDSTGLTEGSHCSVCNTVLKAQDVIPKLQRTEYSITYHISNGDEYLAQQTIANDNPSTYTSEEGVSNFSNPSVPGYQFLGWYDLPAGDAAENVKSIPAGTTGNIDLYAKWKTIPYNVSFEVGAQEAVTVENVTYTVDQTEVLPVPRIGGYIFAGWSNEDGQIITKIPIGTTGHKTYSANWVSERNQAWTNNKIEAPIVYEDEETNTILFAYNIGEIRNVPLSVIHDFGKIDSDGVTKEITTKFTKTTSKSEMEKYANTVQDLTSNSYSWSLSKEWSSGTTVNEAWAREEGKSIEEIESISKNDSNSWYVSSGTSGSDTSTELNTSDKYDLHSTTKNTKTHTKDQKLTDGTISANLDIKNTTTIGASVPIKMVKVSAENKTEVGFGISGSYNVKTDHLEDTKTDNTTNHDWGESTHGEKSASHTSSWNTESGRSASSSVTQSNSLATTLTQKLSQTYNIGKSYINTDSESSTQGTVASKSEANEYSSAVTYSAIESEEIQQKFSTLNTKSGYHRWIIAGTAHVFAIVGYDIATGSYFTTTYTIMDDETHEYEDYSFSSAAYNDNQNTYIPFEIPQDIDIYVANCVCKSDGLEISKDGKVTNYTGSDDYVIIPEYTTVDNKDGTTSVIKVTGIEPSAFAGKNITGIELSDYITEIPAGTFENCTLLKTINAKGITKIGNNAFAGCTSLEELAVGKEVTELGTNIVSNQTSIVVKAANKEVIEAAVSSGARDIVVSVLDECTDLSDTTLTIPNTVDRFVLNGFGETYHNIRIVSDAKKTIINRANFVCNGQTPLVISSPNVELHEVNVTSPGICLALTADNTNIALRGESVLTANAGNSMLCKEISLSQIDASLTTSLTVDDNLLIFTSKDSILTGEKLLNVTGRIIGITEDEFNNYLKGVFTANFDANGGVVSETSRTVVYGSEIGELPIPTRDYYTFEGWYTDEVGGEQITADTVFTSTEDVTYYAHWIENPISDWVLASELPENAKVVNTKYTYTLRSYTTSSSSSLSGWTKYDTQRTSWGATQGPVYSDPSNGSRNVWSEQYEVSPPTTHYVLYHRANGSGSFSDDAHASSWSRHSGPDVTELVNGYYSSVTGQRYKAAACSICGNGNNWHIDYTWTEYHNGTRWYYQEPVYTYYFYKDENKESTTSPSGSDISNVQEWVQYRVK